jgi:hypothetical protein
MEAHASGGTAIVEDTAPPLEKTTFLASGRGPVKNPDGDPGDCCRHLPKVAENG